MLTFLYIFQYKSPHSEANIYILENLRVFSVKPHSIKENRCFSCAISAGFLREYCANIPKITNKSLVGHNYPQMYPVNRFNEGVINNA